MAFRIQSKKTFINPETARRAAKREGREWVGNKQLPSGRWVYVYVVRWKMK